MSVDSCVECYIMISRLIIFFIATQSFIINVAHTAKDTGFEDPAPIRYPGPVKELDNRYGNKETGAAAVLPAPATVSVPNECEDKTFCTVKPPDYPQEMFNKLFKGKKQMPQASLIPEDLVDDRIGDSIETDGCESKVSYEPLYQVRSRRDDDWRTVVQSPQENFVQRVRLEECKNPNQKCFPIVNELGIETSCKQKFSTWEFLVSDGKGGTERIKAQLPICCSCHYRL